MASSEELMRLSVEEYLALEERGKVRHEYVAGYTFAMAEATVEHDIIVINVAAILRGHLRQSDCCIYTTTMKVRVEAVEAFYYPDVMVTCEPSSADSVFKSKPVLLVEVLSPDTELTDRREKLSAYFKLESLMEYVLISQGEKRGEIYRRGNQGKIQISVLGADDGIQFKSLPNGALNSPMRWIYEDVHFTEPTQSSESE